MATASDAGVRAELEDRVSFEFVRYANCWEDADVLCRALRPGAGKRLLSIASAGDNTLALLAEGAEVVAVDLSPAQLACLELRVAAFRRLNYSAVLSFLGVHRAKNRWATYERLAVDISPASRMYWSKHAREIARGIIHAGKLEAYFRLFRRAVLPLIHRRKTVLELLREKDAVARREFWDRTWNNRRWRLLFSIFFGRTVMARAGRDPEFFRYAEGTIADRIMDRARYALTELPTHDNPYLDYIAGGNFTRALPRYLRAEHFDAIRSGLSRLTLVQGPIQRAGVAHAADGFDGFNLSDIFEYLDPDASRDAYARLLDVAKPGARLAYWNAFVRRTLSEEFADRVRPLDRVARELYAQDRAFFYSAFCVDEVA